MDTLQSEIIPGLQNHVVNSTQGLTKTTQILIGFLILFSSVYTLVCKWKNRHFNKLASSFPGPMPLPLIGNGLEFVGDPENIMSQLISLKTRYATPFRIWLGHKLMVVIAKPEDLQIVLNNSKILEKDDVYRFFRNTVGTGLFSAPVEKWKKTRKVITPAFNAKLLEQFIPVFNDKNAIFIKKLQPHCSSGNEFDLWPYVSSLALDIICQTALGVNTNVQDDHNSEFAAALARASELDYLRIYKPWLHSDFIFDKSYAKELKVVYSTLHGLPKQVIQSRKEEFERKKIRGEEEDKNQERSKCLLNAENEVSVSDNPEQNNCCSTIENSILEKGKQLKVFLDILLELNDEGLAEFSDKDMLDEVVTMMVGGSETSAVTNCFCLLLLAMHPDIQDKVYEEQFKIFGSDTRPISNDDLGKMIYTEQVLKETLRLYPPGPVFLRHVKEDTSISGNHVIPAGATVVVAPIITHMSPDIYEDPYTFNPENFSQENLEKRHRYSFIPFSGGPRGCIGSRYAMMSMKATISTIIRKYKFSTSNKQENIRLRVDLLIRCVNGWNVSIEPRIKQ